MTVIVSLFLVLYDLNFFKSICDFIFKMAKIVVRYFFINIRGNEYLTQDFKWEKHSLRSRAHSFKASNLEKAFERSKGLGLRPVSIIKSTYQLSPLRLQEIKKRVVDLVGKEWPQIFGKLSS